ncbi:hypothetical protein BC835DRAFT_1228951, partial [Cytidiella melzeri]
LLLTSRVECPQCNPNTVIRRSLRLDKDKGVHTVTLLDENLVWTRAELCVASCSSCNTLFYPDKLVYSTPPIGEQRSERRQKLEDNPLYICISKSGVWAHRRVALLQEHIMQCFAGGWASFADWVNSVSYSRGNKAYRMTARQSKRLFIEHFSRRLLHTHTPNIELSLPAHAPTDTLTRAVWDAIGQDGGVLPGSLTHGCKDCTHQKRYRADLVAEGAPLDAGHAVEVAGIPGAIAQDGAANPMPDNMPHLPAPLQQEPPPNGDRGMVRMAVMNGKTIGHRICALTDCQNPLVNYKNGRFCETHLQHAKYCGIIPCGRPVADDGPTCDDPTHQGWYKSWVNRFKRLSFPGVRRVIRRREHQQVVAEENGGNGEPAGLPLRIDLPALGNVQGNQVVHTFRARSLYCLETVQWACGMPIGWGKCYKSESQPQVLAVIDRLWENAPDNRPSFIAYDDACDLLRHIVTQDAESPWLTSTKFIVDAWHYTGHRATDVLCRLWCNPAPSDGSQPDLVEVKEDANGQKHLTRAFNTETAEQLNSWLTSYEAQLRQMTDVSYDFFVHVLMLLFAERIEQRIVTKGRGLADNVEEEDEE